VAFTPDEVILFSGGMDSFAGAIEELAISGNSVVLVSHRSASKIAATQKRLIDQLRKRFGARRVLHLPVWVHVDSSLNKEPTHRTRSFLFAALGAVTATLFGRARIRIYENGVVSLNLPPIAQVIGARATRTTHPQVLAGFHRFLSELIGRCFDVENPFVWLTKAEVVRRISVNGCGDLIRDTRSCTRVREMTILHPHCGQCSQCIDRRFAVLVAGQEDEDPAEAYKVDLFSGERPPGPDREMVLAFVRSATRINQMADVAFFANYGETSRIVGYFDEPADAVAERILDLHRRHAFGICRIFDQAISRHASALRQGNLPSDCLISLIVGQRGALSGYPIPKREPERLATDTEIRIAVDEKRKRVMFDSWGELKGKNAELLIMLAAPFRKATRDELAPQNFPFVSAVTLRYQTNCPNEEAFRRRILRCRNRIANLARAAGSLALSTEAVIENIPRHGYCPVSLYG
jgi:7-cyano-7-deazaguanine synthase in queuosine biosynthesis